MQWRIALVSKTGRDAQQVVVVTTSPTAHPSMGDVCNTFAFILLNANLLLVFLNELQIRFEGHIEHCTVPKHKLCWHCTQMVWTMAFMALQHDANMPLKPNQEQEWPWSLIWTLQIMLSRVVWHLSIMEFKALTGWNVLGAVGVRGA